MLQKKKLLKSTISILLVLLLTITCMPISAIATTSDTTLDIASIEVEPITIIENTNGYIAHDFNPVTNEYDLEYYHYVLESLMQFRVILKDGTIIDNSNWFDYTAGCFELETSTDQSYENQWKSGNTYTMRVCYDGFAVDALVTIIECPIENIEIEPLSIIANTDGDNTFDYNTETDEYSFAYHLYNPEYLLNSTITLKDGTIIHGKGPRFTYCDITYYFDYKISQSYENRWEVGNTYNMNFSFLDFSIDVPITIIDCPFENIEIKPITILDGTYCYYQSNFNFDYTYLYYEPECVMEYTITLKDGTTLNGTGDDFKYDGKTYNFTIETYQSYKNQWTAGNTYPMNVTLGSFSINVPVTITASIPTLMGDADNDGLISIKDATTVQEHIAKYQTLSEEISPFADVDNSGDINILDVTYIQMYVSNLLENFDTL